MTVKGKTDTNGYLFKQVNHLLSIHHPFKCLKKSIQSVRQTIQTVCISIGNTLASFQSIATPNGSDIHLNSLCICSPTRGVRLENCSILLVNQSYNQLYGLIIVFIRSYSLPFSSTLSILLIHSNG